LVFATAAAPRSGESSGSLASMAESTRETKNEATEAIRSTGSPASTRRSMPRWYAATTAAYASTANRSVTFTLMPSAIDCSIAWRPSLVPGILISTFGRSSSPHRRRAASIVPAVSRASRGSTSKLTNPSCPSLES
jgi:hypothetical protein